MNQAPAAGQKQGKQGLSFFTGRNTRGFPSLPAEIPGKTAAGGTEAAAGAQLIPGEPAAIREAAAAGTRNQAPADRQKGRCRGFTGAGAEIPGAQLQAAQRRTGAAAEALTGGSWYQAPGRSRRHPEPAAGFPLYRQTEAAADTRHRQRSGRPLQLVPGTNSRGRGEIWQSEPIKKKDSIKCPLDSTFRGTESEFCGQIYLLQNY